MNCKQCKKEVHPEAMTCPHCGFTNSGYASGAVALIIGLLMTVTIVLSPLGIPLMIAGTYAMWMSQKPVGE